MIDAVNIRPYETRDRARVRKVCYLTGYMGDPVDWLWRDRESFADMFTGYYTDGELRYAGQIRDGLTKRSRAALLQRLRMRSVACPFVDLPHHLAGRGERD